MKYKLLFGCLIQAFLVGAQNGGPIGITDGGPLDNFYLREHVPTKRMIQYEHVREADVMWSKRVWRSIDLREKINHPLYFPFDEHTPSGQYIRNSTRWSLWTILRAHIINGDLTVFSTYNPYQYTMLDGDQFKYPIKPEPGRNYYTDSIYREKLFYYLGSLGPQSDIPKVDVNGDPIVVQIPGGGEAFVYDPPDTMWIDSKDIVQYHIKEDWFFDKERSVMDQRILGIAPVVYKYETSPTGQITITGMEEKFWLYFPHCRYILNNYFAYNDKNDAQWMSFDDYFWKRRFSSTIYKESNVFDREIDSYRTGTDALIESERITEEIRTFESDVWNF